jgi:hypothetical protein
MFYLLKEWQGFAPAGDYLALLVFSIWLHWQPHCHVLLTE